MPAKKIDTEKRYKVLVKKSFKVGRSLARAGQNCTISGALLNEHKDDVSEYKEV